MTGDRHNTREHCIHVQADQTCCGGTGSIAQAASAALPPSLPSALPPWLPANAALLARCVRPPAKLAHRILIRRGPSCGRGPSPLRPLRCCDVGRAGGCFRALAPAPAQPHTRGRLRCRCWWGWGCFRWSGAAGAGPFGGGCGGHWHAAGWAAAAAAAAAAADPPRQRLMARMERTVSDMMFVMVTMYRAVPRAAPT